jgi:hypothetical protein
MVLTTPVHRPVNTLKGAPKEAPAALKREFEIGFQKMRPFHEWEKVVQAPIPLEMSTRAIWVQFWIDDEKRDDQEAVPEFEARRLAVFAEWRDYMLAQLPVMVSALSEARSDCDPTPWPHTFVTPGDCNRQLCGCLFIGFKGPPIGVALRLKMANKAPAFGLKGMGRGSAANEITPRFFRKFLEKQANPLPTPQARSP